MQNIALWKTTLHGEYQFTEIHGTGGLFPLCPPPLPAITTTVLQMDVYSMDTND